MSLTLVYIGAAAGLVPAASLRALAGGGAVVVPEGLGDELLELVAEAAGVKPAALRAVDIADSTCFAELAAVACDAGAAADGGAGVMIAVAGPKGPQLARELRRRAPAGVALRTVPAGGEFDDAVLGQELASLKRIVDVLRVECPWDREQTPRDIIGYTLEEVYELIDAVVADDRTAVHGELGDLLLQVVLLALMLSERGGGDLGSVAHDIEAKLIRRHPHIFADAVAETPADVKGRWERIKREQEGREGIFHDVPASFPALLHARKLQQRASSVGFDWGSAAAAFPKVAEEHAELAALFAEAAGADPSRRDPRVQHELGDLLFATVNVARLLHLDPDVALREASRRFRRRVTAAAALAAREGRDWTAVGLDEQERYYQRAKAAEALGHGSSEGESS